MSDKIKLRFDLNEIASAFDIKRTMQCAHLDEWLAAIYVLDDFEQRIIGDLHEEVRVAGDYWNEEELKIQFVGSVFYVAKVNVPNKVRVFYERPMAAQIGKYNLAVITDCLVATPMEFIAPQKPYFFLQEFKKGKGEKKDPEAQMLQAMIIAQYQNADDSPIYGGFFGSDWRFATLIGKNYCVSKKIDASEKTNIERIVFALRKMKDIVLANN